MTARLQALVLAFVLLPTTAFGQSQATGVDRPPSTVPLSDIVIALLRPGGDGCSDRCTAYRVIVRGTGVVEYYDMGGEPREPDRQRSIEAEEVVSLLDALLKARFLDAPDEVRITRGAIRRDDSVVLSSMVGGRVRWYLALTLGDWFKLVQFHSGIPAELSVIRDRLDALGGPSAWTSK